MVEIRILNEIKDESLLREAWSWAAEMPDWFQTSKSSHKETLESFISGASEELIIGVLIDSQINAVVRIVPFGPVHELHLMAKMGMDWQVLANAGLSMRNYVFERGLTKLGGWVPRANRPITKLYRHLGFEYHGLKCYQGTIHGKAAEWRFYQSQK